MRSLFVVLFLSATAFAASIDCKSPQKLSDVQEFKDVVEYLNENASGNDLYNLVECFSSVMDDVSPVLNVLDAIPWPQAEQYVAYRQSQDPKFTKLNEMVNDAKFRELIDTVLKSDTVKGFLQSSDEEGLKWAGAINFILKAVCETAVVSHEADYSEGVCPNLRKL